MASVNHQESMYNAIYHCPSKKTYDSCSKVLAKELHMRIIKTAEDGNCFFDTLATYGWAYQHAPLEYSHHELRQIMVDYIFDHLEDYHESIVVKNGEDLFSTIEWLRGDGNYEEDMGDLVSQIAADAFDVNIYIYNVEPPTIRRLRANQIDHPGGPIHMLRIGRHYKLLLPQEDAPHVIGSYASIHENNSSSSKAAVSKAAKSKNTKSKAAKSKTAKNSNHSKNGNNGKNGNSVNNISYALSKVAISNHTHKNHGMSQLQKNIEKEKLYHDITVKRMHDVLLLYGDDDIKKILNKNTGPKNKKEWYHAQYRKLFKNE